MKIVIHLLLAWILCGICFASQAWVDWNLKGLDQFFRGEYGKAKESFQKSAKILEMEFESELHVERLLVEIRLMNCHAKQNQKIDWSLLTKITAFQPSYIKLIDSLLSLYIHIPLKERKEFRALLLLKFFNHLSKEFYVNYPLYFLQYQFLLTEEATSSNPAKAQFYLAELEELQEPFGKIERLGDDITLDQAVDLSSLVQKTLERLVSLMRDRKLKSLNLSWLAVYCGRLIPVFDKLLDVLDANQYKETMKIGSKCDGYLSLLAQSFEEVQVDVKKTWYGPQTSQELENCKDQVQSLARALSFYQVERGAVPEFDFAQDSNKALVYFQSIKEQGYFPSFDRKLVRKCFWDLRLEKSKLISSFAELSISPSQ